ncbi:MAG: serine/threonine protein kinase [Bradymonadaceae bacterium]
MSSIYEQLQGRIREGVLLQERYRIGKPVGAGAYGMIFSAVDEQTGETVAIKAIPPANSDSSRTAHGRFQREMMVIRNLLHTNIIAIYDWGETDDHFIFMVLEFIEGETLDVVVRNRPLPIRAGIHVARQIALALQVAHAHGVIHRDLKPANVMLTRLRDGNYKVKVLDFGMAKLLSVMEGESIVELTREGMAVGTPRYIAPEQARGHAIGPPADLYALGLLIYEIMTGAQAVKADSVEGAVTAHVSSKPLDLPELEDAHEAIHPVVLKLLEKNVDKRFQDTAELIATLNDIEAGLDAHRGRGPVPIEGIQTGDLGGQPTVEIDHQDAIHQGAVDQEAPTAQPPAPKRKDWSGLRLPFTRSQGTLELDYEAYNKHAPIDKDPLRTKRRRRRATWFRLPITMGEGLETGLALLIAPIAFLFITAHLPHSSLGLRFAIGGTAPLIALIWSLVAHRMDWRFSFWRLLWTLSLLVIFIAHLLGPAILAQELLRNPTWFLIPLGDGPVVEVVGEGVTVFARHYALFIQSFWPFNDPTLAVI